jgi:tetratricopeptide (TPR) repeat protein
MSAEAGVALGPSQAGAARCPVCGDGVDGPRACCPRCETPHHSECWNFNEGCALFGCKAALVALELEAEALIEAEVDDEVEEVDWRDRLASVDPLGWKVIGSVGFAFGILGMGGAVAIRETYLVRELMREPVVGWLLYMLLHFGPAALALGGTVLISGADLFAPFVRDLVGKRRSFRLPEETPLKVLEARLGSDPKNPHLLEMVAFHYYADDRYEDAQELYERSLSVNPNQPRIAYQRAKCLERRGHLAEARHAFIALTAGHASKDIQEKAAWFDGMLERRLAKGEPPAPPEPEPSGPFEEIDEPAEIT